MVEKNPELFVKKPNLVDFIWFSVKPVFLKAHPEGFCGFVSCFKLLQ